ncbi:MAG: hypothetical protein QXN96_01720 [Candidatus Bathyarchaeia archaeon]
MEKRYLLVLIPIFLLSLMAMLTCQTKAESLEYQIDPAKVQIGVWLVNVEKVDLAASSYRLDFYLWFKFNPSEICLADVKKFEFVNGPVGPFTPLKENETSGYVEYRIKGDFIKTFDFTNYPFETHTLAIELEHKELDVLHLRYIADQNSTIDEAINVAGWEMGGYSATATEHSYGDETFSRFIFSVQLRRPTLSSFVKSVLPIIVITTISLLTFFMSPQNFGQRIGLGVTTLMSATAFHLSLLSSIPPIGYLTFADRMMISVYIIFLYNLSVSVYIMKLVDAKKTEEAAKFNKKAMKSLVTLIIALIMIQIILLFF